MLRSFTKSLNEVMFDALKKMLDQMVVHLHLSRAQSSILAEANSSHTLLHGLRWRIQMRILSFLGLPWDSCAPWSWRYNYYVFLTLVYSHYQCRHTQPLTHALTTMIPDVHTLRTMHQSTHSTHTTEEMKWHVMTYKKDQSWKKVCI